jgi:hypothetical protein
MIHLTTTSLVGGSGSPGVEELAVVVNDPLDETLGLEVGDRTSSKGSVDLHSVDEGRGGDDSVGGDFLHDSVATQSVKMSSRIV